MPLLRNELNGTLAVENLNIPSQESAEILLPNASSVEDRKKAADDRFKLIWKYLRQGGSMPVIIRSFLGFIVTQFGRNVTHYWLTIVTESAASEVSNGTETMNHHDWRYQFDMTTNMNIYAILIGSSVIIVMVNLIFFYLICMKSSINIHNGMTQAILRAPMHFFDRKPMGNIRIMY